ncbi:MAG TPA: hypothetical protein DCP92_06245 [Nitrospiraceae bacterium]|jgi:quinol monooxygenase YgiN|nr:hypothetical protein [Nitrospiraceae bacterium]
MLDKLSALGEIFAVRKKRSAINKLTVTLKVIQGKREELVQTLRSLQQNLEKEEGFSKCTFYEDASDSSKFNLIEEWDTQDHLDNYLKSDLFRVLIGALKVLSAKSEVRYRLVSSDR